MKIIKILYIKFILSFSICVTASLIIFFIFSLIGNLNEGYLFNTIINLSVLNSLQILTFVSAFIFLISVILFTIFIKSKNEIMIIKSYLSIKKLIIFFFPIVFLFTLFEINKKDLASFIENSKNFLIYDNNKSKAKIIIYESDESKNIIFLKNIDLNDFSNLEYRLFTVANDKIKIAEFSDNLILSNNNLIAKNYTVYKNDLIKNFNEKKLISLDIINLINYNSIVKNISKKPKIDFNIKIVNLLIFYFLFLNFIFLIFFNKKFVDNKNNLLFPIFLSLTVLVYYFIIFNNSLNFYRQEIEILASMVAGILFLRAFMNE